MKIDLRVTVFKGAVKYKYERKAYTLSWQVKPAVLAIGLIDEMDKILKKIRSRNGTE